MLSPDYHGHGIPLFGHLDKRETEKRWREWRSRVNKAYCIVYISCHPFASVNQRCNEAHPCHWCATAPLKGKVSVLSSPQYSSFPDSWWSWSQCSRGWDGKALLFLPDREAPQTVPKQSTKSFVLHLRTTAPYLQLLRPVMCQTVWGWEEWSQSVLLSFFIFLSNPTTIYRFFFPLAIFL